MCSCSEATDAVMPACASSESSVASLQLQVDAFAKFSIFEVGV